MPAITQYLAILYPVTFMVTIMVIQGDYYSTTSTEMQAATGYFMGAVFGLLNVVAEKLFTGNVDRSEYLDLLLLTPILPFAALIGWAGATGLTSPAFNFASALSTSLFCLCFWPFVKKLDGQR